MPKARIPRSSDAPKAIPTVYNGIQLKSRLEAQAAAMFDFFGWEWKYEPFSIMLPGNINYMPDFWLPDQKVVFETRGYSSDKGNRQLSKFARLVAEGLTVPEIRWVCRFIVAMGDEVSTYAWGEENGNYEGTMAVYCAACKEWWLIGVGEESCPSCRCSGRSIKKAMVLSIGGGKLFLNGLGCERWAE